VEAAIGQEKVPPQKKEQELKIPENLTPGGVDAYLATLDDRQVRQVLAKKLKQEAFDDAAAAAEGEAAASRGRYTRVFYDLAREASAAKDRIFFAFSSEKISQREWAIAIDKMSEGRGTGHLLVTLLIGFAMIASGLFVERLLLRSTEDLRQQLLTSAPLGRLQRFGRFVSRLLLDALGVGAYMLTTFVLFVLVYDRGEAGFGIVSILIIVTYYLRIIMLAAKVILAPASAALRVLPLQDHDANFLYRWIVGISFVALLIAAPSYMFLRVGKSQELYILFYGAAGLGTTILLACMIWQSRQRVAAAISPEVSDDTGSAPALRARFARSWHFFAILYVLGMGAFWLINLLSGGGGRITKLIAVLFLLLIFFGLDQWGQRLLEIASGELPETIDLSGDDQPKSAAEQQADSKTGLKHYVPFISRAFRVALVAFLFFLALRLWEIDIPIGRVFTTEVLEIVVVLMLGFVGWQLIKARIERKLEEEMPDEDQELEEGGAGGSRSVTLLLLLRKFVLAVLVVIVSLIILSSIGLNIGPLIAGAGVIGLAIGFGAQTLVKDIIAGVFFLIDDAFRVGDYIQAGTIRGSVEHISLRSLRLRHHRGMLITVPFGDMQSVTNYSRDYIVMKLEFRVRYDTDVNKVKKIIKKINEEIQQDEELGSGLLDKIKSQGVRAMDDSAMIMRVKFKAVPGEQFVLRREVFRRIQEAFQENGIEFAHRNVTVYFPPESSTTKSEDELSKDANSPSMPKEKMIEAGAAAAIATEQPEEATKKPEES
jgi:small-conductance mechanosensitive channel